MFPLLKTLEKFDAIAVFQYSQFRMQCSRDFENQCKVRTHLN